MWLASRIREASINEIVDRHTASRNSRLGELPMSAPTLRIEVSLSIKSSSPTSSFEFSPQASIRASSANPPHIKESPDKSPIPSQFSHPSKMQFSIAALGVLLPLLVQGSPLVENEPRACRATSFAVRSTASKFPNLFYIQFSLLIYHYQPAPAAILKSTPPAPPKREILVPPRRASPFSPRPATATLRCTVV